VATGPSVDLRIKKVIGYIRHLCHL